MSIAHAIKRAVVTQEAIGSAAFLTQVRDELDVARQRLAAAEAAIGSAALAEVAGEAGGERAYAKAIEKRDAGQAEVAKLSVALSAAQAKADRDETDRRRAAHAERIANAEKHLKKREQHAATLASHIAGAVAAWRALFAETVAAATIMPNAGSVGGMAVTHGELNSAVAAELWRVGGAARSAGGLYKSGDAVSWPNIAPTDLDYLDDPTRAPALVETIKRANAYASDVMNGRIEKVVPAPIVEPERTAHPLAGVAMPAPLAGEGAGNPPVTIQSGEPTQVGDVNEDGSIVGRDAALSHTVIDHRRQK